MAVLADPYKLAEYLLVLEPHEALCATIQQVKKHFADAYKCPAAAFRKPHITLVKYMQYDMIEARLLPRLQRLVEAVGPFVVELADFGSFPTHTIYIEVRTKTQIGALVKSLQPLQAMMKLDKEHKPHFITEPHITVARKLLPWQYEKGWLEYGHTQFSGRFMADHLLLLRKRQGEKRYALVQKFELAGVKQTVKQATLF